MDTLYYTGTKHTAEYSAGDPATLNTILLHPNWLKEVDPTCWSWVSSYSYLGALETVLTLLDPPKKAESIQKIQRMLYSGTQDLLSLNLEPWVSEWMDIKEAMHRAPLNLAKPELLRLLWAVLVHCRITQMFFLSVLPAAISFYPISEHAADAMHSQLWCSDLIKLCMVSHKWAKTPSESYLMIGTFRKYCIGVNKLKWSQLYTCNTDDPHLRQNCALVIRTWLYL